MEPSASEPKDDVVDETVVVVRPGPYSKREMALIQQERADEIGTDLLRLLHDPGSLRPTSMQAGVMSKTTGPPKASFTSLA